jgi:hypothetical protein
MPPPAGTVALIGEGLMDDIVVFGLCYGCVKQAIDELDLSHDPWLFMMDVTAVDRSYRLEPT